QAVGVEALDRDGRVARLSATLVIAADGRTSVVAQRLGLRRAHRLKRMALVTYVSGLEGCRDYGEVFVDPPDYAILNPVAADRANLSVVVPLDHAAPWSGRRETFFTARIRHLPHLARRLAGARTREPHRPGPRAATRPPGCPPRGDRRLRPAEGTRDAPRALESLPGRARDGESIGQPAAPLRADLHRRNHGRHGRARAPAPDAALGDPAPQCRHAASGLCLHRARAALPRHAARPRRDAPPLPPDARRGPRRLGPGARLRRQRRGPLR